MKIHSRNHHQKYYNTIQLYKRMYSGRQWCGTAKAEWDRQLPKQLYICQNVTQMNMLLHCSPRHTSCEFHDILATLRWFWELAHSAVAVPHHCHPLYMRNITKQIYIQYMWDMGYIYNLEYSYIPQPSSHIY